MSRNDATTWPTDIRLTLPIPTLLNPIATQEAVERSRSRWHWFTQGQRRNPALGTLSYLPVEIRWLIWREFTRGLTWQHLLDRFYIKSFQDSFRRLASVDESSFLKHVRAILEDAPKYLPVPVLRRGMPLVGLELDEMYLTTTAVKLDGVGGAYQLVKRSIAPWQLSWLRHLSFVLDSRDDNWLQFFERDLFPNLTKITLDLAHYRHLTPYEQYKKTTERQCAGDACLAPRRKHHTNLRFWAKKTARDVDLLEIVTALLGRKYPSVTIQLAEENVECRLCHEKCLSVMEWAKLDNPGRTSRVLGD
ncbi:MAG: hypothetical protein Q9207_003394 [Kuettlingeria erythrocarpa]